ncbi:hypothetical protein J3Q64DRAFT_1654951 [Phycomyces blakesleeanus]|uniref:Uncharacterized protein n=1 Tax=Phycomyces blakesleeanus TaxID=4837 RepID=A0ABR3B6U8_PHYBL
MAHLPEVQFYRQRVVALPQFDGVTLKNLSKPNRPTPNAPLSPNMNMGAGGNNSADQLTPEERNKYINMFQANNPIDGVLGGDSVKNILIRSKLSPETLHAIWNLADTRKSGTLNQTEFIIAMHYVSQMMKKSIQSLPATLPVHIYTAAAGRFGPSRQFSAVSPVMRQMSTQNTHSITTRQMTGPSAVFTGDQSHHPTRGDLDVSPEELAKYSVFFENLNTNGTGYVSGVDAVHFFRHSKLPESDLAKIWDLADTNSSGQLSKQEFGLAMHLINKRMAGGQIPTSLPGLQRAPTQVVNVTGQSELSGPQYNGQQRSLLETELSSVKNDVRAERDRAERLASQHSSEAQAVHALQEQLSKEKQSLESWKKKAEESEKLLEQEKKKRQELSKELHLCSQETKHYQQRSESAKKETEQVHSEVQEMQKDSFSNNSVFALSNTPSNELFTNIGEKSTPEHSFSHPGSAASSTIQSPSMNPTQFNKSFDPFSGMKSDKGNTADSPKISLNRIKQEHEAHQKRSSSPNVDISDIEVKFPDLNTMEEKFNMSSPKASPAISEAKIPTNSASPVQKPYKPSLDHPFGPNQSPAPTTAFSPKQSKSVAKYGFDLSAFETPSTPENEGTSSVKDELSSLFGSPQPEAAKKEPTTNFDDIFSVTPSSVPAPPTENKKTFADIFF